MMRFNSLQKLALAFPEVVEKPHFQRSAFRVRSKIFLTYDPGGNMATVKLSQIDQNVFSLGNKDIIYPVPNKWGKQGWTMVYLGKVRRDVLIDLIRTAYCQVAPKTLATSLQRGSS